MKITDRLAYGVEMEAGLYYVVKYRLNKERRFWREEWRGDGRDKASAMAEMMRLCV